MFFRAAHTFKERLILITIWDQVTGGDVQALLLVLIEILVFPAFDANSVDVDSSARWDCTLRTLLALKVVETGVVADETGVGSRTTQTARPALAEELLGNKNH